MASNEYPDALHDHVTVRTLTASFVLAVALAGCVTDGPGSPDTSPGGDEASSAFAALEAVFDRGAFVSALEAGELPARFTTLYRQASAAGTAAAEAGCS